MKTIMRAIIITFVLMCGINNAKADNTYTLNATIINVTDSIVSCEDINGNVWEFYGEGYHIGETIVLIMNANRTKTIYDDIVVDVQN